METCGPLVDEPDDKDAFTVVVEGAFCKNTKILLDVCYGFYLMLLNIKILFDVIWSKI